MAKQIDNEKITAFTLIRFLFDLLRFLIESIWSLVFVEPIPFRKIYQGAIKPRSLSYLCIFSHYDKHNVIDDYVVRYLKELFECGCEMIFVSGCRKLSVSERKKVEPYCTQIVTRRNHGKDFGAYKYGIKLAGDLHSYELVILANDSAYGPLYPLKPILESGLKENRDFWGITDSWQHGYHLQGYFVVFKKGVFLSKWFNKFWNRVRCLLTRSFIVKHYEIGMSKYFLRKLFRAGSWCDYLEIKQKLWEQSHLGNCGIRLGVNEQEILKKFKHLQVVKKYSVNPCSYFWDVLIADFRCPFIKRDLLQWNPDKVDLSYWPKLLTQYTSYDSDLILSHLRRVS